VILDLGPELFAVDYEATAELRGRMQEPKAKKS
jgi:hypothetical protein